MTHAHAARARRAAGAASVPLVAGLAVALLVGVLPASNAGATPSTATAAPTPALTGAGDGADLDGVQSVPHQPFAKVPPIGTTPPPAWVAPVTAVRGTVTPTSPKAGLTAQSLELVMRTPSRPVLLKVLTVDLPPTMTPSYPRVGVRLDGPPPRDLAVGSFRTVIVPTHRERVAGNRHHPARWVVVPVHRRLVITLKASVKLGKSVALRVWVSRFRNPTRAATYAVPVQLVGLRGVVGAAGTLTMRIVANPVASCPTTRASNAIARENALRGSSAWVEAPSYGSTTAAYADRSSTQCGETVNLRVDSSGPWFTVWAWRMGAYGTRGARVVWESGPVVGTRRAAPVMQTTSNGLPGPIEARWPVSLSIPIGGQFVPGMYLLQVRASDGGRTFVPLVVRDRVGSPRIAVVMPTFTWQAYNTWGGASAYGGMTGVDTRSRVVSFDRPYRYRGDGGYLASELPFVRWAESRGYDLTYLTDEDLDSGNRLLRTVRAVVIPGHSEYWTSGMRAHLESMVLARGGNVAFLASNNVYWRPRRVASPYGPGRRLEIYRYANEDPLGADPAAASVRWRDSPISDPEQAMVGNQYACLGADVPYVVPASPPWPFDGSGLVPGTVLAHMGIGEIDRVWADQPMPAGLRVLSQVYAPCGGAVAGQTPEWDVTAYATAAGGAVIDMGTFGWTCQLTGACQSSRNDLTAVQFVQSSTARLLAAFGAGPAGAYVANAGAPWSMLPNPSPTPTPTPTPTTPSPTPTVCPTPTTTSASPSATSASPSLSTTSASPTATSASPTATSASPTSTVSGTATPSPTGCPTPIV